MSEKKRSITPMEHYNMSDFLRGQASKIITSVSEEDKAGFASRCSFPWQCRRNHPYPSTNTHYIKGIISLPSNLFYGTGIPACLIFLDKEDADTREDIFFIDASNGFKKDGNKNRLREQDIERIVRVYTSREEIKGYSHRVLYSTILEKNNGNLNVPRYIQKIDDTLPQNITAHLKGGIPKFDIDSLSKLWVVSPELKSAIFKCVDPTHDIYHLALESGAIENTFEQDQKLQAEKALEGTTIFESWRDEVRDILLGITAEVEVEIEMADINADTSKLALYAQTASGDYQKLDQELWDITEGQISVLKLRMQDNVDWDINADQGAYHIALQFVYEP